MLERTFRMSSTQSGFMSGAYDIAAMFSLLPITYLGGRRRAHKPRFIGIGLLVMGMGSIIFSMPAFFISPSKYRAARELCVPGPRPLEIDDNENYTLFFWILFIGNVFHGVGASPLYTIVVTFIDENVPIDHSSLYLGVYYMMAVVGPFIGIVAGGALAQIDGEFLLHAQKLKSELTPDSPAWVGCWWLGFLACGLACHIFSIPILGLPKELPETRAHRSARESANKETTVMTFTKLGELPYAVFHILKNPKFLFISFAGCCEAIIFSGMGAFFTKLLHQQFGLTPYEVALYMCIITIPSTLAGIFFGGWIIKFYKMDLKDILIMAVCLMLLTIPCISGIFISCPNLAIAGITVPYSAGRIKPKESSSPITLISDCNKDCNCDESAFSPVCGNDQLEYYSPCFAGCMGKQMFNNKKVFLNCSCIEVKGEIDAISSPCKVRCTLFPLFVILLFSYQMFSFSTLIPSVTSTLRVVDLDSRSLALGVQWLLCRALGTIPGPVIFGHVIDKACVHWHPKAGHKGNCLLYDSFILSRNLGLVLMSFKFLEIVCFSIALCLAIKTRS